MLKLSYIFSLLSSPIVSWTFPMRSVTRMKGTILFTVACCVTSVSMASDPALTATKLFIAVSEECSMQERANFVFSPHSVLGVFHMAQRGAEGETRLEMDAFSSPMGSWQLPSFETPTKDGVQPVRVVMANRIYGDKSLEDNKFFENFDGELQAVMGCSAKTLDFTEPISAAAEINEFVGEATRGHIKELVSPSSLSAMTKLVLVNALYFKAPWSSRFNPETTTEGVFYARSTHGHEERQKVKFMQQALERGFTYYQDGRMTAFSMSYKDRRLRMFVYMPEDINEFEEMIAAKPEAMEVLAERVKSSDQRNHELVLKFPKFKLPAASNRFNMVKLLKRLGVRLMFDPKGADLSGMTGTRGTFVSSYEHQADIDVDENGTEAAAATASTIMLMSIPMPKIPIYLTVNKPFVFQVRFDDDMGVQFVLFSGRLLDAMQAQ